MVSNCLVSCSGLVFLYLPISLPSGAKAPFPIVNSWPDIFGTATLGFPLRAPAESSRAPSAHKLRTSTSSAQITLQGWRPSCHATRAGLASMHKLCNRLHTNAGRRSCRARLAHAIRLAICSSEASTCLVNVAVSLRRLLHSLQMRPAQSTRAFSSSS